MLSQPHVLDDRALVGTRAQTAIGATGDANRLTVDYQLDSRGRVDQTTDPESNVSSVTFDSVHGQVATATNALLWSSSTSYDQWRRPTGSTDVNGLSDEVFYDKYSRVTSVRNPHDSAEGVDSVRYTYGETERPVWVKTEGILDETDYTESAEFFDGFGRTVLNRTQSPNAGENYAAAVFYNDVGQLKSSSDTYTRPSALMRSPLSCTPTGPQSRPGPNRPTTPKARYQRWRCDRSRMGL